MIAVIAGILGASLFAGGPVLAADALAAGEVQRFGEHAGDVYRLALSWDRAYIATAGKDKLVYVLDATTLRRVKKYGPHASEVRGVAFARDKTVIVGTLREQAGERTIFRWDWDDDDSPATYAFGDTPQYDLRLASSERWMAGAFGDQSVKLYPLADGERANLGPKNPELKCRAFIFLPGGQRLLMGGGGGVALWQVEEKVRSLGFFEGDNASVVTSLAALRDADQVLSGHSDGALRIWSMSEERIVAKFSGHAGEVNAVAVAPGGQLAASGGADKIVRVWNIANKTKIREFPGHSGNIHALVFASDKLLVSSSQDGTVRMWSLDAAATPSPPTPMVSVTPVTPTTPSPPKPRVRVGLPAADKITEALALTKTVFADDFAHAKKPADKVKLAQKLMAQADDDKAAAADRFAFMQEALRLAVEASQTQFALKVCDQTLAMFVVPADYRTQTMTRLSEIAAATRDQTEVAAVALRWANDARAVERFDEADQLTKISGRLAVKAKADAATQAAKDMLARIQGDRERLVAFAPATEALAKKVADPAPRLAIGRYLCFNKGDWKSGVGHLAKGPAGPLKTAAEKELAENPDPLAVAEAWQAAAEKALPADQPYCLAAAIYWYQKAQPTLSGLQKLKADQALKKIGPVAVSRR
jgi:WD40 repeat protein